MRLTLLFSLLCGLTIDAKSLKLSPPSALEQLHQILSLHSSYSHLNEELIQRALLLYLQELDPLEEFISQEEVLLDEVSLRQIQEDILHGHFSIFEQWHRRVLSLLHEKSFKDSFLLSLSEEETKQWILYKALQSLSRALDPHTSYFSEEQALHLLNRVHSSSEDVPSFFSITHHTLRNHSMAVIHLPGFYRNEQSSTSLQLAETLDHLRQHPTQGLLLDLRDNPGGLLLETLSVARLFLTQELILYVEGKNGHLETYRKAPSPKIWEGPLVVLVNKQTASAAEILAQTLQDYGRALVLGDDHTFGKGTFQQTSFPLDAKHPINPAGEFKVTRGFYYTASGKSPQLLGVEADIVISGPLSPLPIGEKHSLYPLPSKALDPYCLLDDADPAPTIPPYLLRMEELKTLFEQRTKSGPTSQLQGSMEVLADLIDFYLLTQKNQSI